MYHHFPMGFPGVCAVLLIHGLMKVAQINATDRTEIEPPPTINGRAIVPLPLEANATVSVQCVSYQDGGVRHTKWHVQFSGETNPRVININDETDPFVISGLTMQTLTIINITQNMQDLRVWCALNPAEPDLRFQFKFLGRLPMLVRIVYKHTYK